MCDFDKKLGVRLRTIRQLNRMSQERLGDLLGVAFQQIQKYETGANRIAPERLDKCATIFDVPVGYFFGREGQQVNLGSFDKRVMTVAAAIASLPSDEVGKRIYHLILAIKDELSPKDTVQQDNKEGHLVA